METQTSNDTIQQPRDFGQRIGVEYWRKTPHVWSSQGTGKPCGLCLLSGTVNTGQHLPLEPYAAKPVISSVVSDGHNGGYHFTARLSCGHGPVGFVTTPPHAPKVGDTYDCWDCQRPMDERNFPGLPTEIRERIDAGLPKCPMCGGGIATIPFIERTVHAFSADVDFQTGEITAESTKEDAVDEEPDWLRDSVHFDGTWTIGELEVECENNHAWSQKLSYRRRDGEHFWRMPEPAEVTSIPEALP